MPATTKSANDTTTTVKKPVVRKRVIKKKVVKATATEPNPEETVVAQTSTATTNNQVETPQNVIANENEVKIEDQKVVQEEKEATENINEINEINEEIQENEVQNDENQESSSKTTKKNKLKKEDFVGKFDHLFSTYEDQLKALRKQPGQSVSLHKYLLSLKNDVYKILKLRKRQAGVSNNCSGFLKPVDVSSELLSFLSPIGDEEVTRVLVTRKLCQYVKSQGLQNEADKRFIIPDSKLKSLFSIAENDNDTKLSYYSMQQGIQKHIMKKEKAAMN